MALEDMIQEEETAFIDYTIKNDPIIHKIIWLRLNKGRNAISTYFAQLKRKVDEGDFPEEEYTYYKAIAHTLQKDLAAEVNRAYQLRIPATYQHMPSETRGRPRALTETEAEAVKALKAHSSYFTQSRLAGFFGCSIDTIKRAINKAKSK